jgi:hypothetical protein
LTARTLKPRIERINEPIQGTKPEGFSSLFKSSAKKYRFKLNVLQTG